MDTTSVIRDITIRLGAPAPPLQVVALAWQAADLAESIALRLVYAGNTEDVPAYLTAADAFAAVRTDLDDHVTAEITTNAAGPALADSENVTQTEDALAGLARAVIAALTSAARTCGDPELALACSQASLSAADAAEATTRTGTR